MQPLPSLPQTRRVVTGHCPLGKAIFEYDDELNAVNPFSSHLDGAGLAAGLTLIHRTKNGFPVDSQGGAGELQVENLHRSRDEVGIVCEVVDIPPRTQKSGGVAPPLFLHRNLSLDYVAILSGTVNLVLDDGIEKTLKAGDVVVQKGTLHAWKNVSNEYCRFLAVIVPSKPVQIQETGEYLKVTKIPGLTD